MAASDNAVNISVSFFIRFFSVDGCKSLSRRVFFRSRLAGRQVMPTQSTKPKILAVLSTENIQPTASDIVLPPAVPDLQQRRESALGIRLRQRHALRVVLQLILADLAHREIRAVGMRE